MKIVHEKKRCSQLPVSSERSQNFWVGNSEQLRQPLAGDPIWPPHGATLRRRLWGASSVLVCRTVSIVQVVPLHMLLCCYCVIYHIARHYQLGLANANNWSMMWLLGPNSECASTNNPAKDNGSVGVRKQEVERRHVTAVVCLPALNDSSSVSWPT